MRAGLVGAIWLATAGAAFAQNAVPAPPAAPPVVRDPSGGQAASDRLSNAEIRDLLDSARAMAKTSREAVDYARVVPDILTQVLIKLDKIEDKLDKVENAVKASSRPKR